ncbi:Zn-ribbon domain-containing OB-fold protein [Euzebya tangerina]|uniref:Zn-ribbon domain-containing OB-fold protein n=1 Tax=Euzebya tangerina TaxID=591198 RepID=UPI00196A4620|nr:OB-fold domain-containing protein [Euzebya tangerina]
MSAGHPNPLEPPLEDRITTGWWDATRDRRLVLQTCAACGTAQHYPRALCTTCGATDQLTLEPASGEGVVHASTVVHRAPHPDLETPYVIALVDLAEGPRLMTRLDVDPETGPFTGRSVTVGWWPLPDGRALPVFTPTPSQP